MQAMKKKKVPQVVQLTQTECGLASALMVMKTYGSRESLDALREECDPGRDGLSVRQLRDLFLSRGFESKMYRALLSGLRKIELPAVIFWENYHFVVLESLTATRATIVDPASGRRRVSMEEFQESYSGVVIEAVPLPDYQPIDSKEKNPWPEFLAPLRQTKGRIALIALLSFLVFGASLVVPFLTRSIVDSHTTGGSHSVTWMAALGVIGFTICYVMILATRVIAMTSVTIHIGRETMGRVFGHMLFLPYKYFSARAPGELLFRLNSVNQVRDLVASQLAQAALDFLLSAGMVVVMLSLSPVLALAALGFYFAVLGALIGSQRIVSEALDAELSQTSKSQSMQLEAVVAVTALKLSGSENRFLTQWNKTYERALKAIRRHSNIQGMITAGISTAQVVAPLAILLIGLIEVIKGASTLGTVVAFQAVASSFFGLATSLFSSYTLVIQARQYLNRLADITHAEKEDDSGTDCSPIFGTIDLDRVGFRYSKHSAQALHNISMRIRPGEKIAIVGKSGSGKSTLGRVLCGLIEPTEGTIRYEGRPKRAYLREHFYHFVGYVPQEVHLLNRTILENITMSGSELGEEQARKAACEAMVAADIESLPMGYQTLVAEMGGNFSGGQRQRIALARALIRNPRVLVLDEATSSLDTHNESRIATMLRKKSCTIIVIAHRMSTVVDADRIYVLDRGQIVECGSHEELLENGPHYRDLFASSLAVRH